jgi:hypothetical protein
MQKVVGSSPIARSSHPESMLIRIRARYPSG